MLASAVLACKRKCRFFPSLAELLAETKPGPFDEKEHTTLHGRITPEGTYQPWGGACQCHRCVTKEPRPGFYKAPPEYYAQIAYENEQSEAFWKRQAEKIPHIQKGEKFEDYKARIRGWDGKP